MYDHLRRLPGPATRDEVAGALGLTRRAAAFHLDRLLEAGLLRASYSRPPGRSGPGAGRPAKRYEPAAELSVQLPPRRYNLVARMLLAAAEAGGDPARATAIRIAEERGAALGADVRSAATGDDARARIAESVLERHGYEPVRTRASLDPQNCPFAALSGDGSLTCAMNHAFLAAFADALGLRASKHDVSRARCCVRIELG